MGGRRVTKNWLLTTLICASRLPHANLSTLHTILDICYRSNRIHVSFLFIYLLLWEPYGLINILTSFCDIIFTQGNVHAKKRQPIRKSNPVAHISVGKWVWGASPQAWHNRCPTYQIKPWSNEVGLLWLLRPMAQCNVSVTTRCGHAMAWSSIRIYGW